MPSAGKAARTEIYLLPSGRAGSVIEDLDRGAISTIASLSLDVLRCKHLVATLLGQ
jgi:hypothetical protein